MAVDDATPKDPEKFPILSAVIDIDDARSMHLDTAFMDFINCKECKNSLHNRYDSSQDYIYVPRNDLRVKFEKVCQDLEQLNKFLACKEWRKAQDPSGSETYFFYHDQENHDKIVVIKNS